jgi:hypothetical protein
VTLSLAFPDPDDHDPLRLVTPDLYGGWQFSTSPWKDLRGVQVPATYQEHTLAPGSGSYVYGMSGTDFQVTFDFTDFPPAPYVSPASLFTGLLSSIGLGRWPKPEPRPWPTATSKRAEPIVAWKTADLVVDQEGVVRFQAGNGTHYGAEAVASCHGYRDEEHLSPDPTGGCRTCGFYAVMERPDVEDYYGDVVLQVELYGRVIRHTAGYRAEKQRVLAAWLDPVCPRCQGEQVAGFRLSDDDELKPSCAVCTPMGLIPFADVAARLGTELRYDARP